MNDLKDVYMRIYFFIKIKDGGKMLCLEKLKGL
jgi:hypothetical protein